MKRLLTTLYLLLAVTGMALAQRTVVGTVSSDDGEVLTGATVRVKGSNRGTTSDISGKYSLANVPDGSVLTFTYTGYESQEVALGVDNVVNVTLKSGTVLQEAVVTALGISRYKNELPYSAQKVDGSDVTRTRDANVTNALAGKVAGLEIKRNNNLGGSTNVVLRGTKSLTGNNQALFVVDGVPIDNSNTNSTDQQRGRLGYDYGNAASDINSDDIESVTVLKGAAATALYGSRASNGVVMITTKQGRKNKGIGVTINTGMNMGVYDPTTFAKFQDKYGGGYGQYYEDDSGFFLYRDINGDGTEDLVMPTSEDASYGGAFDPNLQVYQWDAFDPTSPNYGKSRPWVAAANGPASMFETAVGTSNSFAIDGANDKGFFKLNYTRNDDKGIMPNSRITKNLVNFGANFDLTSKLHTFASVNYTSTEGLGRYGTGYDSKNLMTNFRQWWQVNVDVQDLKNAYDRTQSNITWNWTDPTDLSPIYWDNPYWTRYENYQNDHRDRYFGYAGLTYNITKWLDFTGRFSLDQYNEVQEERIAVGSVDVSEYSRFNRNFQETNLDLMLQFKPQSVGKLSIDGLLGSNIRKSELSSIRAKTNGGLSVPGLYALSNSRNGIEAPVENYNPRQVNGVFGKVGFVYDSWAILDLTMRADRSSTLPQSNNTYYYPSASLGIIFSKFVPANDFFTFGKLRVNYAEVGNDAPTLSVSDIYNLNTAYNGAANASLPTTKNNADLKPERTQSSEAGVELRFFKSRLSLDVTYYKQNTYDQIFNAPVSRSTGYAAKFINAGNVENKGWEVQVGLQAVRTRNFDWRVDLNWSRNRNKVIELAPGVDNLQLASFQGGVSVNAALGEPYGTIRGGNFVYDANGNKVVAATGFYKQSATSNEVIGNVNPDWRGGINNTIRYKGVSLSFLIDAKMGGDLFSLDQYYGQATGLYPETVRNNDLGNDIRLPLAEGGGVIVPGVKEDGTPNDKRVSAVNFGIDGYRRNPAAGFIYDGKLVKLREANLNFNLPTRLLAGGRVVKGATIGVYARNPWIIFKNTKYSDPEDGLNPGNVQGYQVGSYPSVRTFGVNLNVKF